MSNLYSFIRRFQALVLSSGVPLSRQLASSIERRICGWHQAFSKLFNPCCPLWAWWVPARSHSEKSASINRKRMCPYATECNTLQPRWGLRGVPGWGLGGWGWLAWQHGIDWILPLKRQTDPALTDDELRWPLAKGAVYGFLGAMGWWGGRSCGWQQVLHLHAHWSESTSLSPQLYMCLNALVRADGSGSFGRGASWMEGVQHCWLARLWTHH